MRTSKLVMFNVLFVVVVIEDVDDDMIVCELFNTLVLFLPCF